MEHTDIQYIYDVQTYLDYNKIPLYIRVKIIDVKSIYFEKYGEICEYNKDNTKYLVNISNNDVAGFNNIIKFDNEWFLESEFILLDNGLYEKVNDIKTNTYFDIDLINKWYNETTKNLGDYEDEHWY
jgi:hypothetical protein